MIPFIVASRPLAVALSGASQALSGETNGFFANFSDSFFYSTTGFYGSMRIKDTGTPANDYDSSPRSSSTSKFVVAGSSLKIVRESNGFYDFAPHNLFLHSEDLSQASWLKNFTASVTGTNVLNVPASADRISVFMTAAQVVGRNLILSADLSGTPGATFSLSVYEDGVQTIQQVTLTATPTRYSVSRAIAETATDVRAFLVRNGTDTATSVTITNLQAEVSWVKTSPRAYLKTTTAIVYDIPYEWDASGNLIGVLFEDARTNLALRCSDLTHAAWTATNMSTARTATGPNNQANHATTITASAGNATILQSITSASANRDTSFFIKRRTGTGTIEVTQDNGTTWTAAAVTGSWAKFSTPAQTIANPVIGIRVVTSGDAVDVAWAQHETGTSIAYTSSPIYTIGATVTRAIDNFSIASSLAPAVTAAMTLYAKFRTENPVQSVARMAISFENTSSHKVSIGTRSTINDYSCSVTSAGSTTAVGEGGTMVANSPGKAAIGVASNDAAIYADGVQIATDASTGVPGTAPNIIRFGSTTGSTQGLNGHLIEVGLYTRRLSNAELATLTAA